MNLKKWLFGSGLAVMVIGQTLRAQQADANRKPFEETKAKAEMGDAEAQTRLGIYYELGKGVTKDSAEAVKWYRKAANQENPKGQYYLGTCYASGTGVTESSAEAVKWYTKAAELGDANAQDELGVRYLKGDGVTRNTDEAVKWFLKAAEQDNPGAQFMLVAHYTTSGPATRYSAEAVKWYRKSAERGDKRAQLFLGVCYAEGHSVTKNFSEAVKWFVKAAEQGDADAQRCLVAQYMSSDPATRYSAEAIKWCRKSAEQDDKRAQLFLGVCYAEGRGVTKDFPEAVKWYRKAAEQNEASAQFNLGLCYSNGEGVTKDEVMALKWYRKAAEQNNPSAQHNVGVCYAKGDGVAKDVVEGYKWMLLAAGQGDEGGKRSVALLENKMSQEQIAEGQKLARNFKPHKALEAGETDVGERVADAQPSSSGSGFFITDDGYLVTNEHVAGNGAQVRLVTAAGLIVAKVVKVDAANDLALIKAEGKFLALPVTASRSMKLGNTVVTVGFPNIGLQGFSPKFARGEIASLSGAQDDARYFQISVPVQPGNSGGALVDERGNVVGVVSAKLNARAALAASGALPENVNYAVKSSFLLSFLESVPEVAAKLKDANTKERKFEDVVKSAEQAAVLVLVY